MYNVDVSSVVLESRPEGLKYPISSLDHGEHIVNTALMGYPQLAADHVLNTEMRGKIVEVTGGIIRHLNLEFVKGKPVPGEGADQETRKVLVRQRAYEVLAEIAINLVGAESGRVGFSKKEVNDSLRKITYTLERWESLEEEEGAKVSVAKAVVNRLLLDMKKVMKGKGMVGKTAAPGDLYLRIHITD
mgnify:CR=1 FL=1